MGAPQKKAPTDTTDKDKEGYFITGNSKSDLYDALLLCRDRKEIRDFMRDLCTPKERLALSERWVLARLLDEGSLSYRDISAKTGASTTTIGRVARFLQQEPHQGYRRILKRLKEEKS